MIPKHQVLSILFVDISGYTIMMGQNEEDALIKLKHFKRVIKSEVNLFRGEIKQFYGDGCLIIFQENSDAVDCARKLQKAFVRQLQLPVRIGIHSGEVIVEEDNVFGDVVNIASRIEAAAIPGSVLISETIYNQLKSRSGFQFVPLGKFYFKNVTRPYRLFALYGEEFSVPSPRALQGTRYPYLPIGKKPLRSLLRMVISQFLA